jgi:hydroxyacyl-ACP dehydratase HTD2-like protein with hotdog domain
MLVDLFQRNCPGKRIVQLDYSARSPMYGGLPFTLYGKQQDNGKVFLWAEDCEGTVSMTAELLTV